MVQRNQIQGADDGFGLPVAITDRGMSRSLFEDGPASPKVLGVAKQGVYSGASRCLRTEEQRTPEGVPERLRAAQGHTA